MRRYTTEHISSIAKKLGEEMPLIGALAIQEELVQLWQEKVVDQVLLRAGVSPVFDPEKSEIVLVCPSSAALSYATKQRIYIEEVLSEFVKVQGITRIIICLN